MPKPETTNYLFISSVHRTFSKREHKTNINKFEIKEIIQSILSKNSGFKLEINNKGNILKQPMVKLKKKIKNKINQKIILDKGGKNL